MLKLMILCSNLNTAQTITNKIASNIENTKIIGIGITLKEALNIMKEFEPDIIISTNLKIFKLIKEKFLIYNPGIIYLSDPKEINELSYKKAILIDHHSDFNSILKLISNFITKNVSISKKEQIIKTLSEIGFDFKLSGTNYLLDSILYANSYEGSYSFESMNKDIYSHVAEINNTRPNIVKWAIARSINYLYLRNGEDTYKKIAQYFCVIYPDRLTPKFIINFVANKLSF